MPLKTLSIFILLSCLGLPFVSRGEATQKPNIIVFLVDDYDKPETSPYGDFIPGKGTSNAESSQKILDELSVYHTTENTKRNRTKTR